MSKKHLITCWLLVVYSVMAFGPAWASLSCRCLSHAHAAEATAGCCGHHAHHTSDGHHADCMTCRALEQQPDWSAPCCGDRHSTDIALYINDDDRTDRSCFAPVALPLSTAEYILTTPETPGCAARCDHSPGALCRGSVRSAGAHAPPVRG